MKSSSTLASDPKRRFTFRRIICAAIIVPAFMLAAGSLFAQQPGGGERPVADLIAELRDGTDEKKLAALRAMSGLGPKAKSAVPELVAALKNADAQIRADAAHALRAIGPDAREAEPALRALLHAAQPDLFVMPAVLHALMAIGAKVDLPLTRGLLLQNYPKGGSLVIGQYLPKRAAEFAPLLVEALRDADPLVRLRAAESFSTMTYRPADWKQVIGTLGDGAKPIGPALVTALGDSDERVVPEAAYALTHMDATLGAKAIPVVIRQIRAGHSERAFLILLPVAQAAIPELIAALDEPRDTVRNEIATVLALLEGSFEPLTQALRHENRLIRAGAARALGRNTRQIGDAGTALVEAMKDTDRLVRLEAAEGLIALRVARCVWAVPVLAAILADGEEEHARRAATLLGRLGREAGEATPALLAALQHGKKNVRIDAAMALTFVALEKAVAGVPMLTEGLASTEAGIPARCMRALGDIGPAAIPAVPSLEKFYAGEDVQLRHIAAEAVARIDAAKTESAVTFIVSVVREQNDKTWQVQRGAMGSLRRLGVIAKSAAPALEGLLEDSRFHQSEIPLTAILVGGEAAKKSAAYFEDREKRYPGTYSGLRDIALFLHGLSPAAQAFISNLTTILNARDNSFFRHDFTKAILAIRPEAKELEPHLRTLLATTNDKEIKAAVTKALRTIGAKE